MASNEPRAPSIFRLDLGGKQGVLFRECSGIGGEVQVIESTYSTPQGTPMIRKVPGNFKYTNITLKKGVTNEPVLYDWWKMAEEGKVDESRVDGQIHLIDESGGTIQAFSFAQGWIQKFTGPAINAQSNEMAIEEIVIVHELLDRIQ
jgi:phage tail-like protein